jgi:predicted HTH transcriptional regulator
MNPPTTASTLHQLVAGWEDECVEFKEANDNFPTPDIGKYFSALSNEANLRSRQAAWLVFGVRNRDRAMVGTTYRENPERLHSLKKQIADGTDPSITFREIHELDLPEGRLILFEIPAAPRGTPIAWNGHFFARALQAHPDLEWTDILALDRIQKGHFPDETLLRSLRKRGLIEGRKPHLRITPDFASQPEAKADYLRHRAFDDDYYCKLILDYLAEFGSAKRAEFDRLLTDKLSSALDARQKSNKIKNLLQKLRSLGKVTTTGPTQTATWILLSKPEDSNPKPRQS